METTEEPKVEGSLRERATAAWAEREADLEASRQRQTEASRRYNQAELVNALRKCGITAEPAQIHETAGGQFYAEIEGLEILAHRRDNGALVRGMDCPICERETYFHARSMADLGEALTGLGQPFPHSECRPVKRGIEWPEQPKPYAASPAEVALLKAAADFVDERVLFLREAGE